MTLPSAYAIRLPPAVASSFWPSGPCPAAGLASAGPDAPLPDPNGPPGSVATYRLPLVRLFSFLQAGADLNMRVVALASNRARAEGAHADALAQPGPTGTDLTPIFPEAGLHARSYSSLAKLAVNVPGFTSAAGAWAKTEEDARAQAKAHSATAKLLEDRIVDPFASWTRMHHTRLGRAWAALEKQMKHLEDLADRADTVRAEYEAKCRLADEAEEAARFSPSDGQPILTLSEARRKHLRERSEATSASSDPAEPESVGDRRDSATADLRAQFGFKDRAPLAPAAATAEKRAPPGSPVGGLAGFGASLQRAGTLSLHRLEEAARQAQAGAAAARTASVSTEAEPSIWGNVRAAVSSGLAAASGANSGEAKHVRLRKESQEVEDKYRLLVDELDRARCAMEQAIHLQLALCEKWEVERGQALGTALMQYSEAFKPLCKVYGARAQKQHLPANIYQASVDLATLIRGYGTGPYTPLPQVFHPFYHHELDSLEGMGLQGFGMNLIKWDRARALAVSFPDADSGRGGTLSASPGQTAGLPSPPRVLRLLLTALDRAYRDESRWPVPPALLQTATSEGTESASEDQLTLARNAEKRKIWLYDVPLAVVHNLRFRLIDALKEDQAVEATDDVDASERDERLLALLASADPPVLAALVKTWASELEETLIPQTSWDTVWSVYRAATAQEQSLRSSGKGKEKEEGGEGEGEGEEDMRSALTETQAAQVHAAIIDDLKSVLAKLPKVHLSSLAILTEHISSLYQSTGSGDALYTAKLGRSLGRALLRPARELGEETSSAVHPYLLAKDLVEFYPSIVPTVLQTVQSAHLMKGSQRPTPVRRRTRPIDMRPSRSSIAAARLRAAQGQPRGLGLTLDPIFSPPLDSKELGAATATPTDPADTLDDDQTAEAIMKQAQSLLMPEHEPETEVAPTPRATSPHHSPAVSASAPTDIALAGDPVGVQLADEPVGVQLADEPVSVSPSGSLTRGARVGTGSGRRAGRHSGVRGPRHDHYGHHGHASSKSNDAHADAHRGTGAEAPTLAKTTTQDSATSSASSFEQVTAMN